MISRLLLLVTLALVACSPPPADDRFPTTPGGITALIRQQSQDFDWEVTDITNNIITTETFWNSERVIRRKYYRGLYPVYGMDFGKSFEMEFDYKLLDQLFPLKIGNTVTFEGVMLLLEDNYQAQALVQLEVTDTAVQQIDEVAYPVYVIEVTSRFSAGNESDVTRTTLSYSFDLGLVLKSVTKGSGAQSYWRIRSIDVPADAKPKIRRRNPAGTVRI